MVVHGYVRVSHGSSERNASSYRNKNTRYFFWKIEMQLFVSYDFDRFKSRITIAPVIRNDYNTAFI